MSIKGRMHLTGANTGKLDLLFIANIKEAKGCGISAKIHEQINALSSIYSIHKCLLPPKKQEHLVILWVFQLISKLLRSLFVKRYSCIYIRNLHGIASIISIPFLLLSRSSAVIVEIPTYPIEPNSTFIYLIDTFVKTLLYKYIVTKVFAVNFAPSLIWEVSAIKMNNCIDVKSKTLVRNCTPIFSFDTQTLNFISVSSMAPWHGHQRLLHSLAYHQYLPIHIYFVGEGPVLDECKSLAQFLKLDERATFTGALADEQLDCVFSKCHIGVDSLGRHNSLHGSNQSLKSREYCARGLPFIKSHRDEYFDNKYFVKDVNPDDSIIPLLDIIEWHQSLLPLDNKKIRDYAHQSFQWEVEYTRLGLL